MRLLFAPCFISSQLQEEKESAKQSTLKQREIMKDSIAKARACTTMAERRLADKTALVSKLQLEKEELKAAAEIQLAQVQAKVLHSHDSPV